MTALFSPSESGLPRVSESWCLTRDGDTHALDLYRRHYSCKRPGDKLRGGNYARVAGPGETMVLISTDGRALFVWRREQYRRDAQEGVNCTVFRNEGEQLSSRLIREAMELAWRRWPGERLFTFVNPRKVQSRNPGYCFLCAGWRRVGRTKEKRLLILEALPVPEGLRG